MDEIDKALDKAKVREFGDFFDKQRTVYSMNRFAKTVDEPVAQNLRPAAWQVTTG